MNICGYTGGFNEAWIPGYRPELRVSAERVPCERLHIQQVDLVLWSHNVNWLAHHSAWKGIHAHLLLLNKLMLLGEKLSLLHLLKLVLRLSMLNLLPDDVWNLVLHVSTRIELVLVTVSILLHRSRYLSLFRA